MGHSSRAPRGVQHAGACRLSGGGFEPRAQGRNSEGQTEGSSAGWRPLGPQGGAWPLRPRAGRAPPQWAWGTFCADTRAVSGEQNQPGGPGWERAGRLHGGQGHASQGRGPASTPARAGAPVPPPARQVLSPSLACPGGGQAGGCWGHPSALHGGAGLKWGAREEPAAEGTRAVRRGRLACVGGTASARSHRACGSCSRVPLGPHHYLADGKGL